MTCRRPGIQGRVQRVWHLTFAALPRDQVPPALTAVMKTSPSSGIRKQVSTPTKLANLDFVSLLFTMDFSLFMLRMYEEACYFTKMSQKLKNHLVEDVFFKNLPVLCENPRKNNKSNIFLVNLHLTFFSFRFFTPWIRIRITTYADPHHLIFPRLTAVIPCRTGRRTPSPALN